MRINALGLIALACTVLIGWLPSEADAFCIGWDKSLPNYDSQYYSVSHEFKRAK